MDRRGPAALTREKTEWDSQRRNLDREVEGLDKRIRNQRHKIIQHQLEINRLDNMVCLHPEEKSTALVPIVQSVPAKPVGHAEIVNNEDQTQLQSRLAELERLAGDLADQRLLLLEQWQRLVQAQHQWENERLRVIEELEKLAEHLQSRETILVEQKQFLEQAEHQFRVRHRELTHLRQHLIAWRARLKSRENALESERDQLLMEVHSREELVEKHLGKLVDLSPPLGPPSPSGIGAPP